MPGGVALGWGGGNDVRIDQRPILFDCFLSFHVSWIPITVNFYSEMVFRIL